MSYEEECNVGEGNGCLMLGYMYSKGKMVDKNHKKVKVYYKKACDLGNTIGCNEAMK